MYENIAIAEINTAVNGIELSFGEKPPYEVLKELKENGFRWHNKKQIWYGRNNAANVRAVAKFVDIENSDRSFGVTPEGMVDLGVSIEGKVSLDQSIKDWYMEKYPEDRDIIKDGTSVTFRELFRALNDGKDVYEVVFGSAMGGDTLSRERIFTEITNRVDCTYSDIYDQWINRVPGGLSRFKDVLGGTEKATEQEYSLGFGHLGNGITVWNRLQEEHGDYKTVAHISSDRQITFYDKNMPDSVVQRIRDFAEKENPRVSYTQNAPVFNTVAEEPQKKINKALCIADVYDSVGGTGIYADSTIAGSLWSSVGSKGYYKDINAYIWCNYSSAVVIELDNAMKRGKECKTYRIYSNDGDASCYLVNELKVNSPKELYDFVKSGKELPGNGQLYVSADKGVEVFSPFVSVKPLEKLPEKWKKSDLVKAIMSGQVFSGALDQRLTDDYAYDAAYNFGSGRRLDLPGQARDLVEGCRDCYIRNDGADENGIVSIHFSYAGDMKTFKFDLSCDLAESIVRQEKAVDELKAHNEQIKATVRKIDENEIDSSKVYVINKVVEDINTGRLRVQSELMQGVELLDRLDLEDITEFKEAEFIHNKLYEVANFHNRREYAEDDARIVNTGNWGQLCSGKAVEELTREGVSLNLSMHSYENPVTFEAVKKDCMDFISGKMQWMFGEKVDYSKSLEKLEAEEVRVAQNKSIRKEPTSLADIIGFAEVKREFEKNQRGSDSQFNYRDNDRDDR